MKPWKPDRKQLIEMYADWLQFGHGGEAVETPKEVLAKLKELMLQFGHGGEAVETAKVTDEQRQRARASIRPRR